MENMQDVGNVNVSNFKSNEGKNTIDGGYRFQHDEKDITRGSLSFADSFADSLDEILQSSFEEESPKNDYVSVGSMHHDEDFSEDISSLPHVGIGMDAMQRVALKEKKPRAALKEKKRFHFSLTKGSGSGSHKFVTPEPIRESNQESSLKIMTAEIESDTSYLNLARSPRKVTFSEEEGSRSKSPEKRKSKLTPEKRKPHLSPRMTKKLQEQALKKLPSPIRKLDVEKSLTVPVAPTLRTSAKYGERVYSNSGFREIDGDNASSPTGLSHSISPRKRSSSSSPQKALRNSSHSLSPSKKSVQANSNIPDQVYQEKNFFPSSVSPPLSPVSKKSERGLTKPSPPRLATMELLGQRVPYSSSSAESRQFNRDSPTSSQRMEKRKNFGTLSEMKNKYLQDFRHYSPVKGRFVPKTTVPSPFALRTEERARLWPTPQTPERETFQFKARPMPSFGSCSLPLSPNSMRLKFTVPEPFDLEIDKRMNMRMRPLRGCQDDNDVGRYRFKALMVPDFTYRPLGSKHEVNLTMPFPFHLKIDERLARRIRFNGTKRSNSLGRAQVSFYIHKARSSDQSMQKSRDNGQHLTKFSKQASPKKPSPRNKELRSQSAPKHTTTKKNPVLVPRCARSNSAVKRVPLPEPKKFIFKAKKMPNFSKPFTPLKTRGGTPIKKTPTKSGTPIKTRSPIATKRRPSPVGIRLRSQSSTPSKKRVPVSPRNHFSKPVRYGNNKNPSAKRASMSPMDTQKPTKFKAKPMPDFSRPFTPKKSSSSPTKKPISSLKIAPDAPVTNKFKTIATSPMSDASKNKFGHVPRASPISKKTPLSRVGQTHGSPSKKNTFSSMVGVRKSELKQSPSKHVSKPPIAPYHTYASLSPSKGRSPPRPNSSKKFKARKMPDFSAPFIPKKHERTPSPIVLKEDSKTFIARPLPDFSKPFVPKKASSVEKAIHHAKEDNEILDVLHEKLAVYERQVKDKELAIGSPEKDKHLANAVVHAVLQDFLKTARTGNKAPRKISIDPRNPELQNIIRESMSISTVSKDGLQSSLMHGSLSLSSSGSCPESSILREGGNGNGSFCNVSILSSEEPSVESAEKTENPTDQTGEEVVDNSLATAEDVTLSSDDMISGGSSELLSSDSFPESSSVEDNDAQDMASEMNKDYLSYDQTHDCDDVTFSAAGDVLNEHDESQERFSSGNIALTSSPEHDANGENMIDPEVNRSSPAAGADISVVAKMIVDSTFSNKAHCVASPREPPQPESLFEATSASKPVLSPQCKESNGGTSTPSRPLASSVFFIHSPKSESEATDEVTLTRKSARSPDSHGSTKSLQHPSSSKEMSRQGQSSPEAPSSPTALRSPKNNHEKDVPSENSVVPGSPTSGGFFDIASYISSPKQAGILSPPRRHTDSTADAYETPSSSGSFYNIENSGSDLSHPLMKVMERLSETMSKLNDIKEISSGEEGSEVGVPGHITMDELDPMEQARLDSEAKLEETLMDENPRLKMALDLATLLSPQGDSGDDFNPLITTQFRGGWHRAPSSPTFSEVKAGQAPPKPEVPSSMATAKDSAEHIPAMSDFALSIITEEQSACSSHQMSEDVRTGGLDIGPSAESEDDEKTNLGDDPSNISTGGSSLISSDQSSGSTNALAERLDQLLISHDSTKEDHCQQNQNDENRRLSITIGHDGGHKDISSNHSEVTTPRFSNKKPPVPEHTNLPQSATRSVFDVILNCCSPSMERKTPRTKTKTPKSNDTSNQQYTVLQSYIDLDDDSISSSNTSS